MSKPEVEIHNWYVRGDRLFGDAKGHPELGDEFIKSSTILRADRDNGVIETRNTIYRLIGAEAA